MSCLDWVVVVERYITRQLICRRRAPPADGRTCSIGRWLVGHRLLLVFADYALFTVALVA